MNLSDRWFLLMLPHSWLYRFPNPKLSTVLAAIWINFCKPYISFACNSLWILCNVGLDLNLRHYILSVNICLYYRRLLFDSGFFAMYAFDDWFASALGVPVFIPALRFGFLYGSRSIACVLVLNRSGNLSLHCQRFLFLLRFWNLMLPLPAFWCCRYFRSDQVLVLVSVIFLILFL